MGISLRNLVLGAGLAVAAMAPAGAHAAQDKVIYGSDDRIDVYQETDPQRLEWAAATCALINAAEITSNGNGTYNIVTDPFRVSQRPACDGEPFANQPTAPYCSGFLAGPDIVVTAGHCITDNTRLTNTRFVFGFRMLNANDAATTINADQVYSGLAIVGRRYEVSGGGEYDYSVVQLDRPVTAPGALPLPIRREGLVPIDTPVGVIGYPTGLPEKISFGANTLVRANTNAGYFEANLDTYGGNSGSPVFNATTGLVEGVLVRGNRDYNVGSTCFESNRLQDDNSPAEEVSKSITFAQDVPELPGEGEGAPEGERRYHSADSNRNGVISLSETLRGIQLYNADVFHCEAGTEDGFALGAGSIDCTPHDSDYQVTDFIINLSELLRLIQLMQAAHYTACDEGEDGFCF